MSQILYLTQAASSRGLSSSLWFSVHRGLRIHYGALYTLQISCQGKKNGRERWLCSIASCPQNTHATITLYPVLSAKTDTKPLMVHIVRHSIHESLHRIRTHVWYCNIHIPLYRAMEHACYFRLVVPIGFEPILPLSESGDSFQLV